MYNLGTLTYDVNYNGNYRLINIQFRSYLILPGLACVITKKDNPEMSIEKHWLEFVLHLSLLVDTDKCLPFKLTHFYVFKKIHINIKLSFGNIKLFPCKSSKIMYPKTQIIVKAYLEVYVTL